MKKISNEDTDLSEADMQGLTYSVRCSREKVNLLIKLGRILLARVSDKVKVQRCQELLNKESAEIQKNLRIYQLAISELGRKIPGYRKRI